MDYKALLWNTFLPHRYGEVSKRLNHEHAMKTEVKI
jgi:hypothetical protein